MVTAAVFAAAGRVALLTAHVAGAAPVHAPQLPPVLVRIRGCESGSGPRSPGNYAAQNRRSSASGAFQVTDGTWRGLRRAVGSTSLPGRQGASPVQQDQAAVEPLAGEGHGQPWNASRRCWR